MAFNFALFVFCLPQACSVAIAQAARPTPEAQSASPELRSGNQALQERVRRTQLGWAYTGDRLF
ncbi:MAG: hypothetical protein KME49_33115 [Brasilonema octagenarum HA4186-MV1]|uniref:hypothetical protein n=1 Tax=Brasilonema TaxID=383614 RepID=UPI00145E76F4|nr:MULTISPECIES: hypothetical protein [Brasilonema]MBW4630223.1 hypothetical protein [Brasilonema octagenarum HA4186-MV1]